MVMGKGVDVGCIGIMPRNSSVFNKTDDQIEGKLYFFCFSIAFIA